METANLEKDLKYIATKAWEVFLKDPVTYIVGFLIMSLVGSLTLGILFMPLAVGYIQMVRTGIAGEKVGIGDVFGGMSHFISSLVVGIIVFLGVFIGSALCVVPGLAVAYATFFSFHLLVYEEAGIAGSLSGSLDMVKKNAALVLVLFLAIMLINGIAGGVAVGIFFSGPLTMIASSVAFELLQERKEQSGEAQ